MFLVPVRARVYHDAFYSPLTAFSFKLTKLIDRDRALVTYCGTLISLCFNQLWFNTVTETLSIQCKTALQFHMWSWRFPLISLSTALRLYRNDGISRTLYILLVNFWRFHMVHRQLPVPSLSKIWVHQNKETYWRFTCTKHQPSRYDHVSRYPRYRRYIFQRSS